MSGLGLSQVHRASEWIFQTFNQDNGLESYTFQLQELGLLREKRFPEVSETKSLEGSEYRAHTKSTERKGSPEVPGTVFCCFSCPKGDDSDKPAGEKESEGLSLHWACRRGPILWPLQELEGYTQIAVGVPKKENLHILSQKAGNSLISAGHRQHNQTGKLKGNESGIYFQKCGQGLVTATRESWYSTLVLIIAGSYQLPL